MFSNILTLILLFLSLEAMTSNGVLPEFPKINDTLNIIDNNYTPDTLTINKIILSGNKVTKSQIIFRELLFHENDKISLNSLAQILEQSRKNLLNTSLFNFVTIDTLLIDSSKINISVSVIERWYIWPMPFFQLSDRNFNVWWETKDFSKADYGLFLNWDNFRGRKESLVIILRTGYDETYGLSYKIPYLNKRKTIGLGITGGFSGNHEIPYKTDYNKQVFFKDKEDYLSQNIFSTFNITYRKNIFNSHTFQLNYKDYIFSDTLMKLNTNFSLQDHIQFFSFYYLFKCDYRDIKAYPLKGYYFDLELEKLGFGILEREKIDMSFLHTTARKFWQLHNRWYFASGINAKLSTSLNQPYFIERGLGFGNDFVRSYEYYVVPGQNFVILKSNLKFELIPTRVKNLKFIPSKKFSMFYYSVYINLLADAAYIDDSRHKSGNNNLSNTALFGTGIGIDFVTYYDKVFRFEYSINRMGESGLFLHFVAPI